MKRKATITLTIAGLLGLGGVLYAAHLSFFSLDIDPQGDGPIGLAASPTDLIATDNCTATGVPLLNVARINCQGAVTVLTQIPTIPGCYESYVAIAPLVSANAGFTPRDFFITLGPNIYQLRPPNPLTPFATIPDSGCSSPSADHTGITFDHVGTFGNKMIVTCHGSGGVWKVDGAGTVSPVGVIAGSVDIEGPAVVPMSFGPHGGEIWVADESYPGGGSGPGALHTINPSGIPTLDVVDWNGAESVQIIPNSPCAFCSGGVEFQAIPLFGSPNGIYQYFPADFTGLGGDLMVASENGTGTALVTTDGTNYFTSFFDNIPGAIFEGSTFVDCDVPSPTPTPTPTATVTGCQASTLISSDFNGTPINAGNYIWFSAVLKPHGLGATTVTITFTNQTITSPNFGPLSVPDASVRFDPAAVTATTTFSGGMWMTNVPSFGLAGNTFLSGFSFPVPTNLPGGIRPVTWSGTISIDTPGVSINWQWAAAVYTNFTTAYNSLGVKPVDDNKASQYKNSDHAGTPENFKQFVIGGARGGGGSNYTGSLSGTASVCRQQFFWSRR